MEVHVIRSARRKKTIAARVVDGRIEVRVPAGTPKEAEDAAVAEMKAKIHRRQRSDDGELAQRAEELNGRYLQGKAKVHSIRWVSNQRHRWGSCSPGSGEIRISDRLIGLPQYVVDAVILHELAHTIEANHSPAFWELADRAPHAERAKGFLEAMEYAQARAHPSA